MRLCGYAFSSEHLQLEDAISTKILCAGSNECLNEEILNPFRPMNFSIQSDTMKFGCFIRYFQGHPLQFPQSLIFQSLKIVFI